MQATARAHSNIALVKYWGKRANADPALNLPATGSLSMTLDALHTTTSVRFEGIDRDTLILQGRETDSGLVSRFLDEVRRMAGLAAPALVESENNFPSASGLASSASAFAALAVAATAAAGLSLTPEQLSGLARRGSGSAARSIFGGFVEMLPGDRPDGEDAHAVQLFAPDHWDLRLLAVLTTEAPKNLSSRGAMERTSKTSPYFPAWVAGIPADLAAAREALAAHDLAALGPLVERNSLRMHASALAADPPVLFWNGATVELLHKVASLRMQGYSAFCTMDAGPHVKVLCPPEQAAPLSQELARVPGVVRVVECRPGPPPALL